MNTEAKKEDDSGPEPLSLEEAWPILERAAEEEFFYAHTNGDANRLKEAFKLVAENTRLLSQEQLYMLGAVASRNGWMQEACKFFKNALEKMSGAAAFQLGRLTMYGSGCDKDKDQAMRYFRQAIDLGYHTKENDPQAEIEKLQSKIAAQNDDEGEPAQDSFSSPLRRYLT